MRSPLQDNEYEAHRRLVESERPPARKKRDGKHRDARARGRITRLAHYSSKELRAELSRRRRKKWLDGLTPEMIEEMVKKGKATKAIRAQYCDHKSKPAKLRASGKNAGFYACPSCGARVPAPGKQEEGLVI